VNLDRRHMYVIQTAELGVVGAGTELRFVHRGARVVGKYAGGRIRRGCLVGRVTGSTLVWHYVQRERSGEMHAGQSVCDVVDRPDGRVRIIERFRWHTRPGSGMNIFDERPAVPASGP